MRMFLIILFILPVLAVAGTVNVLSSFMCSEIWQFGMTWDGTNLWVSDQEHNIIYQVELSGVSLQHSTLGRIKTMFQ